MLEGLFFLSSLPAQDFSFAQGNLMLPVYIGCPPGKRLAFDITYTLEYNRLLNKQYFDCASPDPEMPCFLFRDSACPALPRQSSLAPGPAPCPAGSTSLCSNPWSSLLPPRSSTFPTKVISSPPAVAPSDPAEFYPFFLIQDLVTGDSGSFKGR